MNNTKEQIEQSLVQLVTGKYLQGEIQPELSLLKSRLLDSIMLLALVGDIEKIFGIEIEAFEIDADNFDSITKMTNFILKKVA